MFKFVLVVFSLGLLSVAHAGPLQDAARSGDVAQLNKLLAEGAAVNQNDEKSGTALIAAAQAGQAGAAQALLDAGADVNLIGAGLSPLLAAARTGNSEIVAILLADGADVAVTDRVGNTALHLAAAAGNKAAVLALLDAGVDAAARNRLGVVPALVAGAKGHFDVVDLLREHGGLRGDPIKPVSGLLATADPERGRELFQSNGCSHCHGLEIAAADNRPNLWGIVGNDKGSSIWKDDHSEGLRRIGGSWSYEDLNAWLADPGRFAPGNLMNNLSDAKGLPEVADRADIIAYLRLQDDSPEPLP